jgi:NADH pyrophosphatase NudC (nudix superfamily)
MVDIFQHHDSAENMMTCVRKVYLLRCMCYAPGSRKQGKADPRRLEAHCNEAQKVARKALWFSAAKSLSSWISSNKFAGDNDKLNQLMHGLLSDDCQHEDLLLYARLDPNRP